MWMILFLLLPIVACVYIGWHLWTLLPVANIWKMLVLALGGGSFLLLFLGIGRRLDSFPLPVSQMLYEVGTSSTFVILYLFMLFLVLDLGRIFRIVPRSWLYANGWSAVAIVVLIFGIFFLGNLHYNNKVRVALDLPTDKPLPRDYKIVMASDLHLGYHNPRKELTRWIDLINAEHPDFILIAGDIIDGSMRPLLEEHMAEEFHRLEAPVFACIGNHEYFSGHPQAMQFYRDAGICLLSDASTVVDSCIVIIGRDDQMNRRRRTVKDLVAELPSLGQGQKSAFTILLDHQPHHLEQAELAGIDFQFSGHTHRGQVWPISWITDKVYECSWGSHQRGNTCYYVTSGLGIWGGKFRIGTQSEYIVATLRHL